MNVVMFAFVLKEDEQRNYNNKYIQSSFGVVTDCVPFKGINYFSI